MAADTSSTPSVLGLKKSFGFGDRLGLATPGHLQALKGTGFAGILAQQSIREMTRTQRTPEEVMQAAQTAINEEGFAKPWGADADHLKTPKDVDDTMAAGFTFFTIDPSDYVDNRADVKPAGELADEVVAMENDEIFGQGYLDEVYGGKSFEIENGPSLSFDMPSLHRAAVKYGRAVAHVEKMTRHIETASQGRPVEIEVSVDETETPTSPLEHLFFANELKRRNVKVVSLAPRFIGEFEKGIDYKGDVVAFEESLKVHVAIAREYGPYKISVHSGSDKFSIYPAVGRVCGDLLHVKTAGTSYLEAIRAVLRVDPTLFGEIACYAVGRFPEDKASYHLSTSDEDVAAFGHTPGEDLEDLFLNQDQGRQLLHVTFGSVLTQGKRPDGQTFKEAILEVLSQHADLHRELLADHLGMHLRLLNAG